MEEALARLAITSEHSDGQTAFPQVNRDIPIVKNWGYTHIDIMKCSYTWIINDFSLRREKTGECLNSSTFSAGKEEDNIQWCIELYPKGKDHNYKEYLALYLKLVSGNENEQVRAQFKFSLLNTNKEKIAENETESVYQINTNTTAGFYSFVRADHVLKKGILPNDILIVVCEVSQLGETVTASGRSNTPQIEVPVCNLSDDFGILFENQELCDVTLTVSGGKFLAHKAILAARSPVFQAMFKHDLEEKKSSLVEIPDLHHEVLREMLRFIYTGKVRNLEKMATELLAVADKYALERLKIMCESMLCSKNLSIESAADILILADMHRADDLKAHTIDFINIHGKEITKTAGWKTMIQNQPYLIAEVYQTLTKQ